MNQHHYQIEGPVQEQMVYYLYSGTLNKFHSNHFVIALSLIFDIFHNLECLRSSAVTAMLMVNVIIQVLVRFTSVLMRLLIPAAKLQHFQTICLRD